MTTKAAADDEDMAWPDHAYTPGQTPRHPAGRFADITRTAGPGSGPEALMRCRAWRLGLRWAEAGYFWEAHELFEAVWVALPQGTPEKRLVQALIQIANAGLKLRMERPRAVARLAAMARGLLDACAFEPEGTIMGLGRAGPEAWLAGIESGRLVGADLTGAGGKAIRADADAATGDHDADEIRPARP
ncbi:MAG: DUF309 domain-containing protein [Paracoccaceae bacterium]